MKVDTSTLVIRDVPARGTMIPVVGGACRPIPEKGIVASKRRCAMFFDVPYVPFSDGMRGITLLLEERGE